MKLQQITKQVRKFLPPKYCGAVIVAAGSASRMEGIDKVMAPLSGEPMLLHTVRAFQQCDAIREIVVVTRQDLLMQVTQLCKGFHKVTALVAGGSNRQESVSAGLSVLSKKVKLVAVHDGARPLVSGQLIDRAVHAAQTYGAAAPAIAVKDTIKVAKGGLVVSTPDRSALQAVQTPQVFDVDLLKGALKKAKEDAAEVTDDCSAVERLGMKVKLVAGEERNMKITTPIDLKIAQMLMEESL